MTSRGPARAVGSALAIIGAAAAAATAQAATGDVAISTLSNRADLISGGDALVAVDAPKGVRITLGARDVTSAFRQQGGQFEGLIDNLRLGENVLTARMPDGRGARLTITNHPTGGPIFSGPQIQPWYCLPGALDKQCNRPTTYTWSYKSTNSGDFAPYDPENPPSDIATTTTDSGETVPYIVRQETGTMDRNQYLIAGLADPKKNVWQAWNHKVYMTHGGGCGMGHNEAVAPAVMADLPLSRGYAVMSTTLENNQENCNPVVQAESVMMAKEHLIEAYGPVRYTFSIGGSGASIVQQWIANAYPGIYDGLIATRRSKEN